MRRGAVQYGRLLVALSHDISYLPLPWPLHMNIVAGATSLAVLTSRHYYHYDDDDDGSSYSSSRLVAIKK